MAVRVTFQGDLIPLGADTFVDTGRLQGTTFGPAGLPLVRMATTRPSGLGSGLRTSRQAAADSAVVSVMAIYRSLSCHAPAHLKKTIANMSG